MLGSSAGYICGCLSRIRYILLACLSMCLTLAPPLNSGLNIISHGMYIFLLCDEVVHLSMPYSSLSCCCYLSHIINWSATNQSVVTRLTKKPNQVQPRIWSEKKKGEADRMKRATK